MYESSLFNKLLSSVYCTNDVKLMTECLQFVLYKILHDNFKNIKILFTYNLLDVHLSNRKNILVLFHALNLSLSLSLSFFFTTSTRSET